MEDTNEKKRQKDELMLYWNRFLAGDNDAFSEIYDGLIRDLFSFGMTFTADRELVKDCIQEVFMRLYQNKTRLAPIGNIKVYLLIALKNTLIDAFKKRQVYQKFVDAYDVNDSTDDTEEERVITQESDMAVKNRCEQYKSALTVRQQEIIHYRFVEEMTIEGIAKLLNINYQSVANSIQRSLQKIRKIYVK